MASGYCDFCQIWHSASCCHPGRYALEFAQKEIAELRARLAEPDPRRWYSAETTESIAKERDAARQSRKRLVRLVRETEPLELKREYVASLDAARRWAKAWKQVAKRGRAALERLVLSEWGT